MNFAGHSPFVWGFTKVHIAGDLLPAMLFWVRTAGSEQRRVLPSAELAEGRTVNSIIPRRGRDGASKARWAKGQPRHLVSERLAGSVEPEEALFSEGHGCTNHCFKRGTILAQQIPVAALHGAGRELCVRPKQVRQIVPCGR